MQFLKHMNNTAIFKSAIVTSVIALTALSGANAQVSTTESVAATVNEEMISTFDVTQRIRLVLLTSGGRIPESAYPQLQRKVLQDLIDERLKLQEAADFEFDVDSSEIEQELGSIASSVRSTVPQLEQQLLAQGIAPSTLRDQIKARLVWQRLVAARYRNRIRVNEDEVDSVLDRLKSDSRKEQYLISEICLPIEDDTSKDEIFNGGMQIISQMRNGVPFDALARQFSYCTSSANGGDRGWTTLGELDPELSTVIEQLNEGSVSIPTAHEGMMYIFAVRSKRAPAVQGEKSYQVAYAGAPLSVGRQTAEQAFAKLKQTNACENDGLSIDLGKDIGVSVLPPMPASAMKETFRAPVDGLERGEVSGVLETERGYHAILLCDRDDGLGLPPRQAIEDKLFSEELELVARRYLRDIKRDSTIEVRVGTNNNSQDNS